ncbi:hypothetical protein RUM43_002278, partial [Polyplax serrata]
MAKMGTKAMESITRCEFKKSFTFNDIRMQIHTTVKKISFITINATRSVVDETVLKMPTSDQAIPSNWCCDVEHMGKLYPYRIPVP